MSDPKAKHGASRREKKKAQGSATASFPCYQCGAEVSIDSDRCPKCRSFYIKGLKQEDIDELVKAERMCEEPQTDFVQAHGPSVVQIDGDIELMNLLDDGRFEPGFVSECSHCGTVVELTTSSCPMCGTHLEHVSVCLVDVFADMEFDPEPSQDADCPYCGEHVTLLSGDCPSCGKAVGMKDRRDPDLKVRPLLKARDVVFLHMDIETGEVRVLKRDPARHRYDHVSVHLNGAGSDPGKGKPGLSRG